MKTLATCQQSYVKKPLLTHGIALFKLLDIKQILLVVADW